MIGPKKISNGIRIEITGSIVNFENGKLKIETKDGLMYGLDMIDYGANRTWCQKRIKKEIKITATLTEIGNERNEESINNGGNGTDS